MVSGWAGVAGPCRASLTGPVKVVVAILLVTAQVARFKVAACQHRNYCCSRSWSGWQDCHWTKNRKTVGVNAMWHNVISYSLYLCRPANNCTDCRVQITSCQYWNYCCSALSLSGGHVLVCKLNEEQKTVSHAMWHWEGAACVCVSVLVSVCVCVTCVHQCGVVGGGSGGVCVCVCVRACVLQLIVGFVVLFFLLFLSSCIIIMEAVPSIFGRQIEYVTIFNTSATCRATFRLRVLT